MRATVSGRQGEQHPDIPGYTLKRLLDSGGFGKVYEAVTRRGKRKGERVAVKVVEAPERGRIEAHGVGLFQRFVQGLPEPLYLLPILDSGQVGEMRFFVMPLADLTPEGNPFDLCWYHCQTAPLSLNEVVLIGLQTATGLERFHEQKLVHRDVKRKNVVRRQGRWHVVDYGTVCTSEENRAAPRVVSELWLKGPEDVTDFREDLYALGKVLFLLPTDMIHYPRPGPVEALDPFIQWARGTRNPLPPELDKESSDRFGEVLRRACLWAGFEPFGSTGEMRARLAELLVTRLVELHINADHAQAAAVRAEWLDRLRQLGFEAEIVADLPGSVRLFVRVPAEQVDVLLSYAEAGLFSEFHVISASAVVGVPLLSQPEPAGAMKAAYPERPTSRLSIPHPDKGIPGSALSRSERVRVITAQVEGWVWSLPPAALGPHEAALRADCSACGVRVQEVLATQSDEALALAVQKGFCLTEAFEALFQDRYAARLRLWFARFGTEHHQGFDLTQDLFLKFFQDRFPSYDPERGVFQQFLYAQARKLWIQKVVRPRRLVLKGGLESLERPAQESPEEEAQVRELLGRLPAALATLTAQEKTVLELALAGLQPREIVRELQSPNLPISRVYQLLFNARQKVASLRLFKGLVP